jgi:TolB-like protein/Tfp pilus assembly protein PilF
MTIGLVFPAVTANAGMPPARIFLFGRFEVEVAGQTIPAASWRKRRAVDVLTAVALAPGRALHREELIDRFWPDKDLDAGANNLHRALHEIRRAAGAELVSLDKGVARIVDDVWIDVEAFERAASAAGQEALCRAVEVYRGDLLPDDPYSDSLGSRREGLRQRFVDVALKLGQLRHVAGEIDACIAVLRRALAADAALEPAHRLLMEVLAKAGRQGDALRQFQECVVALHARLDAQPSKAMLDLRDAIERGELGPAQAPTVRAASVPPTTDEPSIAVLPFTNMSGDAEQEFFADGIAEDIITELSRISGLLVIARNSSFVFKNQAVDVRGVARQLGVRHVLEGSVRKSARRVRITAQLIDGSSGGHVWAERYDRDLEDIFAVQDEVTQSIVSQLNVRLRPCERAGLAHHRSSKVNIEAYDLMMRARANLFRFTPALAAEAREMLGRAITIDPSFASAYAVFALIHASEHINGWASSDNHVAFGMQYARRALELDPNEAVAYQAVTMLSLWERSFDDAEQASERAIECGPSYFGAHSCRGQVLDFTGRHAEAINAFEKALRLDPGNDLMIHLVGRAQFGMGSLDEAARSFERRLARSPRSDMSRAYLASIRGAEGRGDEARRLWAELLEINPKFSPERLRKVLPYKEPSWFERFASGLRSAGIMPSD